MKTQFRILALSLWFIISIIGCTFAADQAPAAQFGELLAEFLKVTVFPVLGAIVLGFISWAANKIGKKYKFDSLIGDNALLMQIAAQGVAFAEEKAANYAKNTAPLTGSEKLNAAIAYMLQMAPHVSPEQAQSLVTSALAMLPNAGATGTTAVGIPIVAPSPVAFSDSGPLQVAP